MWGGRSYTVSMSSEVKFPVKYGGVSGRYASEAMDEVICQFTIPGTTYFRERRKQIPAFQMGLKSGGGERDSSTGHTHVVPQISRRVEGGKSCGYWNCVRYTVLT